MDDDQEVVVEYTDQQAVEDGALVRLPGPGPINRVTRAVFVALVGQEASAPIPLLEMANAIRPLLGAIYVVLKATPDKDGWRKGTFRGKTLWAVPNEVGGLTLMFPEDY